MCRRLTPPVPLHSGHVWVHGVVSPLGSPVSGRVLEMYLNLGPRVSLHTGGSGRAPGSKSLAVSLIPFLSSYLWCPDGFVSIQGPGKPACWAGSGARAIAVTCTNVCSIS